MGYKDLNARPETTKLLEENIKESSLALAFAMIFGYDPKITSTKGKNQ